MGGEFQTFPESAGLHLLLTLWMCDLTVLLVHLTTVILQIARPGGVRSVIAESVLMKHQLLILNRSRRRAPNLRVWHRVIAGLCSLWIRPKRLLRSAIAFKPSTLLDFHRALVRRKYQILFSRKQKAKPGPKGADADVIRAIVGMKQRNPTWGCPRIAQQINLVFGTSINKDVVRRILALHYRPEPKSGGPSWLTFLGQHEGQSVERGPYAMRVRGIANVLGARAHGSVHASYHRIRDSGRSR